MRYYLIKFVTHHEPVTFEMPQGPREHPLRDPVHAPADLGMTKLAIDAQGVDDPQGPAVAGMAQHLPTHPVIVVPQAVANRLRILEDVRLAQKINRGITHVPIFRARRGLAKSGATKVK